MTDALKAAREVLVWHENGPRTAQQLKEARQSGKHGPTKAELAYGLRTALAEVERLTEALRAKDAQIAEANALVLSHEGRIDRLTAERERDQTAINSFREEKLSKGKL